MRPSSAPAAALARSTPASRASATATPTLVREKFPRIPRRVSGYNLDELLPENNFNVARALVGSEGTCVNIVSATLNLTASPPFRVLTVLGFDDPFLAADAVPLALEHKPIGLEGFDPSAGRLHAPQGAGAPRSRAASARRRFSAGRNGRVDRARRRAHRAENLVARLPMSGPSPPVAHICTPEEAASVWHVRESALGAMVFVPGEPDRWEGWEDAAVPPEQTRRLSARHHGADGRVRLPQPALRPLRPGLRPHAHQLRLPLAKKGFATFREFIDRAADVVLSLRRLALRRARRRAVARRAAAQDVRA